MMKLTDVVDKIRSKNAGPFWLTIDIFCGSEAAFVRVRHGLATEMVAQVFQMEPAAIRRFELADLHVVKFSLPRPHVQGTISDRDMHGASYATLLSDIDIDRPRR